MIDIKGLTKYYRNTLGVENLDLYIEKGEVFGFIGPNGAGKSTTIKCVMNLINKNKGQIFIDNKINNPRDLRIKESIGYLPSEIHLYDDLKVIEMIEYSDSFYSFDCLKKAKILMKRLNVDSQKKIEELSLGNLKKVGIILALMHNPQVLILDEATTGLDPLMQEEFYKIILEEKKEGVTIFFSSHNLSELGKICDRVGIIKNGKLIKIQQIDELINSSVETITIISPEISKIKKSIKGKILDSDKKMIKIMFEGDINKLLAKLNKYQITKLLIEDPSIEEIFKHYYEEDNK